MSNINLTDQASDPDTPSAGQTVLYTKAGKIFSKDDQGNVTDHSSGGGGGISNVVEDTTPELGGDLDALNNDVVNAKVISFNAELDNGNSGASATINWTSAQKQRVTLTDSPVLSFTAPPGASNLLLKVIQDGTGNRSITWPGAVLWPGGNPPNLTNQAGSVDIVSFYFDGTNYYAVGSLDFS